MTREHKVHTSDNPITHTPTLQGHHFILESHVRPGSCANIFIATHLCKTKPSAQVIKLKIIELDKLVLQCFLLNYEFGQKIQITTLLHCDTDVFDSKSMWYVQVMPDGLICIGQERKLSVCHLWLGKHGRLVYMLFVQHIVCCNN